MTTYSTTKQQLTNAVVPMESRTYKPMSHQEVIDLTLNSIVGAGFTLDSETYHSAKDNNVAVGKYTIKNVADKEMQLQISWLNSYDKSKRLTWGIGGQVRICLNGMISADMGSFKKKHQGEIQAFTPKAITEYVKRAGDVFTRMQKERDEMKNVQVDKMTSAHILGEMFLMEDFITTTQLNIIKREIEMPSYNYESSNSLWEMYNHATLSLKEIHPSLYMKAHMDAHKYFVGKSGLITPTQVIELPVTGSHPQIDMFTEVNELVS